MVNSAPKNNVSPVAIKIPPHKIIARYTGQGKKRHPVRKYSLASCLPENDQPNGLGNELHQYTHSQHRADNITQFK